MNKKEKKIARCPACNNQKHRTEMDIAISKMKKLDKVQYKHYTELKIDTYASFINSDFEWACDACLNSRKAIVSNPNLQSYCWHPHYAYHDSKFICRTCKTECTFSKEEKKFWYENLKFWIDSTPVNCTSCRKEIKQLKLENKTLSEILKKGEGQISSFELEIVIEIYSKWKKDEKVKYYQSILMKK